MRRAVFLAALLVCGAPTLAASTAAKSSGNGETTKIFGDWRVSCDAAGRTCRMSTSTDAAIAVSLASNSGAGDRIFFLLTPLDLLLPKGIEMRIDGGPALRLAFRSCHAQGCIVPFRLDEALERRFRRGARLELRLFDLDAEPLDVELSLSGFSAALEAMR